MISNHLKKLNISSSILFRLSLLVTLLCAIIMIYSFSALYRGMNDYLRARESKIVYEITEPFTDAFRSFMFERGRMNVVLSANEPISDANRDFISERRMNSDEAFEKGFSIMEGKYSKEAELLRSEYDEIKTLRIKMDEESRKTLAQRDPNNRKLWYIKCTDYIEKVISTLIVLNGQTSDSSLIFHYEHLIIETFHFRSIVGNESSLFTSAVTQNKSLQDEQYTEIMFLRGESSHVWSSIEQHITMIGSDNLTQAMETVKDMYYRQFRTIQDRLLEVSLEGRTDDGAAKEIAKLSVPALDSVLLLADVAISEIAIENQKNMNNGYRSFIGGLMQLLIGVLIIVFIPIYLKKSLTRPINTIVDSINNLSMGNTGAALPFAQRNDEIGMLANGVNMLQKSINDEKALKSELQKAVAKLEILSTRDPLTGLYNRRYISERINELEATYKRSKSIFSIILCDIDYFKRVNDKYGHDCGDFVLKTIARLIISCCRAQDAVARWGGEEFLLLLPDTNCENACILAQRIQSKINDTTMQYENISFNISMTLGVSEYSEAIGTDGTIKNADMALLQGKKQCRGSVVVH